MLHRGDGVGGLRGRGGFGEGGAVALLYENFCPSTLHTLYFYTKKFTTHSTTPEPLGTVPCIERADVTASEGNNRPETKLFCAFRSWPPSIANG